jgi:hypothetical protein
LLDIRKGLRMKLLWMHYAFVAVFSLTDVCSLCDPTRAVVPYFNVDFLTSLVNYGRKFMRQIPLERPPVSRLIGPRWSRWSRFPAYQPCVSPLEDFIM